MIVAVYGMNGKYFYCCAWTFSLHWWCCTVWVTCLVMVDSSPAHLGGALSQAQTDVYEEPRSHTMSDPQVTTIAETAASAGVVMMRALARITLEVGAHVPHKECSRAGIYNEERASERSLCLSLSLSVFGTTDTLSSNPTSLTYLSLSSASIWSRFKQTVVVDMVRFPSCV